MVKKISAVAAAFAATAAFSAWTFSRSARSATGTNPVFPGFIALWVSLVRSSSFSRSSSGFWRASATPRRALRSSRLRSRAASISRSEL